MKNRKYMVKKSTVVFCLIAALALVLLQAWQLVPHPQKDDYMPGWEDYCSNGSALYAAECFAAAATSYKIAIEIDPSRAEAYIGAADAYIALDDMERAKEILENGYEQTLSEDIKLALEELSCLPASDPTKESSADDGDESR